MVAANQHTQQVGEFRVAMALIGAACVIISVIVVLAVALPVLFVVLGIREWFYRLGNQVRQKSRRTHS